MQERAPGSGKSARNAAPGHRQDVELDLELTCAQHSPSAGALLPVLAVWAQTSLAWLVLIGGLFKGVEIQYWQKTGIKAVKWIFRR